MKTILISLFVLVIMAACNHEAIIESDATPIENQIQKQEVDMKEQSAEVRITVPDSRWSVQIEKVIQAGDQIAVFCRLKQSDGMGMMVISEVADRVSFQSPDLPIKFYVLGKTWNWDNSEDYTFIDPKNPALLPSGKALDFSHVPVSKPGGPKRTEIM